MVLGLSRYFVDSFKYFQIDDNSAILHPEYPVPNPLNTTSSFQALFDLMEQSTIRYTTILESRLMMLNELYRFLI